jgi:hypothetical protein
MTTPTASGQYNKGYLVLLARAIDILACTWIWRDYDITISSMAGLELRKANPRIWARLLGGLLNTLQANHCELAIASDRLRAQQALAILGDPCAAHQ